MSNSDNETEDKKPGTLSVRRGAGGAETGRVRQSFSHGRTKSVVVEKKRSKRVVKPGEAPAAGAAAGAAVDTSQLRKSAKPQPGRDSARRGGDGGASKSTGKSGKGAVLKALSDEEYSRRVKALEASKKVDAARVKADAEAAALEAKRAAAQAAENAKAEAAAKAEAEAAAKVAAEQAAAEAAAKAAEEANPAPVAETAQPAEGEAPPAAAAKAAPKAEPSPAPAAAKPAKPTAKAKPTVKPSAKALAAAKKAEVEAAAKEAEPPAGEGASEGADEPRRRRQDDGVKTGDQVDISALTTALPGPKIISRAPPKPKEEPVVVEVAATQTDGERSRPRPTTEDGVRFGPNKLPARTSDRDDRTPKNTRVVDNKRRSGKLTIAQATSGEEGRTRSMAAMRRRQERERRKQSGDAKPAQKVYREVKIPDTITVQELSNRMTERGSEVIKTLMKMDMMVTINQAIDAETAQLVVEEFGHKAVRVSEADVEIGLETVADDDGVMLPRAPIVTIMGHVDHGKTSLLDKLRNANVVAGEAGGITQHIGAYQVKTPSGAVTFLDTPGHAAFTAMRARGAQATDIVILVVAADDSVMPQTIEAISHAKAAGVPMIVAINKIDKPAADANRVRTELLQHDIQVEGMGGDVLDVEVSAITGQGLDGLLEAIILQAEILDLRANANRAAEAIVVEAQLDVGRGPVATVLVQRGTLKPGDIFVVGEKWGKVRALVDDHGKRTKSAGPSVPVEVLGLNGTPEAGDTLVVVENEKRAQEVADYRERLAKEKKAALGTGRTLDQLLAQAKADETTAELPIVIKADVQGSAEAIIQALEKIGNDEVRVRILHSGVGAITESDITLAEASGASIIGFNVRANSAARESANQKSIEIRYYSVIYNLVDDVKAAATGLLSPEIKETFIGYAEILQVFKISGVGSIAGCRVTEGIARRSAGVRLLRDNVVIHEGRLKTLKRFKDEVKEVQGGQECGMAFEKYEDLRAADVIEIYETQEVERTL